jgi:hypothetical protein
MRVMTSEGVCEMSEAVAMSAAATASRQMVDVR